MRGLKAFVQLLEVSVPASPLPVLEPGSPAPSCRAKASAEFQHLPESDLNSPGWLQPDGRRSLPRGRSHLPALIPAAARGSAWLPAEPSHLRDRLAAPHPRALFFQALVSAPRLSCSVCNRALSDGVGHAVPT